MPNQPDSRQPSSRGASTAGSVPQQRQGEREPSRRGGQGPVPIRQPLEPQYTVYIRLPFTRNGFVDPPRVDWDASKERYLWKVLSRSNRNTDLDWDALATQLQVSRVFLLQQAAWLYERELSQIQAQMRKVGTLNTSVPVPPSPGPQSPATPVFPPRSAFGSAPPFILRAASSLSTRSSATPTPRATPALGRRVAPPLPSPSPRPMSRPASDATIGQQSQTHRFSNPTPDEDGDNSNDEGQREGSTTESSSGDDDDDNDDEDRNDNRLIRRLPMFLKKMQQRRYHSGLGSGDDDDDGPDEEPAFLPFSAGDASSYGQRDMMGTVTLPPRQASDGVGVKGLDLSRPEEREKEEEGEVREEEEKRHREKREEEKREREREKREKEKGREKEATTDGFDAKRPGTAREGSSVLSGRRAATATAATADGSAGPSSPSMGSSFSDLSDASVSQSAMEEAYLTMQAGGMASRMSSISQAVRSRYFHSQQ